MAIVKWKDRLLSQVTYGRIGHSMGFGEMIFGSNKIGVMNKDFGVYQRRRGTKKQIIVKYKYTYPHDPKTSKQLASRAFFSNIIKIYKLLTVNEKQLFTHLSHVKSLNIQQSFTSEYQTEKPSYLGGNNLGYSSLGHLTLIS